ncbi:MAG: response regulator [Candidatus Peribacteraceae bacterium]
MTLYRPEPRHLLIADDSVSKRTEMRIAAEEAETGLVIVEADSARLALGIIHATAERIAILLSDHSFDGETLNGIDLIRALRHRNAEAFIMLITRHPERSEEFVRRELLAREAGANDALSCFMGHGGEWGDYLYATLAEWKRKQQGGAN